MNETERRQYESDPINYKHEGWNGIFFGKTFAANRSKDPILQHGIVLEIGWMVENFGIKMMHEIQSRSKSSTYT